MGPMIKGVHLQTLTGDDRTEAQKEASKKHSEFQKKHGKTPTPKGGKLSEEHKEALRVPRPGAGQHGNQLRGENHPAKVKIICPHCGKEGAQTAMKRWHFDNCKFQSGEY